MAIMNLKKKVFFASAVATLFAFSASADVRLAVGGDVDAQIGFRGDDGVFKRLHPFDEASDKRRQEAIVHDTTLRFGITGHTDTILNGITFGGLIVLEADTSSSKYHLPHVNISIVSDESPNVAPVIFNGITFPSGSASRDFAYNENRNAREAMLFFEGTFGRFELGNTYGATKKMQIDAGAVAAGNGGVHGDSGLWIHTSPLFGNFRTPDFYTNKMSFYHLDDLFLPVIIGEGDTALPFSTELATAGKVSYYSPNFNGLQLGISFIPDTDITGSVANTITVVENSSAHGFGFENVVEGGLTYDGTFQDFNFRFSILGQSGKAKSPDGDVFTGDRYFTGTTKYEDLEGFEIGFATEFMGVGFAASYGQQEGLLTTLDENKYYTLGLGYEMGPWAFSINYMESTQDSKVFLDSDGNYTTREAEFSNLVFDVSYTCQGLMPYLSVAVFEATRPEYYLTPKMENDGTVVLLGAKLSF